MLYLAVSTLAHEEIIDLAIQPFTSELLDS